MTPTDIADWLRRRSDWQHAALCWLTACACFGALALVALRACGYV